MMQCLIKELAIQDKSYEQFYFTWVEQEIKEGRNMDILAHHLEKSGRINLDNKNLVIAG